MNPATNATLTRVFGKAFQVLPADAQQALAGDLEEWAREEGIPQARAARELKTNIGGNRALAEYVDQLTAARRRAEGLLESLETRGFDKSWITTTNEVRVGCSQCEALAINGRACHEQRCPNQVTSGNEEAE